MSRTTRTGLAAGVLALALSPLGAPAAQAADAYRFWGYYQLSDGAWTFAQKGPDGTVPKDGSVEGYRYALAETSTPRMPRALVTFDQVCASTPAADGRKRVGVVVDPGREADAREAGTTVPEPRATCVSVPTTATGQQVLAAAAQVRVEKSMVCGIDGYPATGCSDTVATVPAAARAKDETVALDAATSSAPASSAATSAPAGSEGGTPTWVPPALVALLALLGGGGWLASRRRRAA